MALEDNKLDKSIPVPLYYQLKEIILKEIKEGNYKSDALIPTENDLSNMFEISRTTVRQAIAELVNDGWLYRIKSKGTFVSKPKIQQDFMTKIESFTTDMLRKGITVTTEVLDLKVIKASEKIANALDILEGEQVIFLYRKRFADGEPIVTIETYLPYPECAFLLKTNFSKTTLYSCLDEKDSTRIAYIHRRVEAVGANADDMKYLNVKKGKPVHFFTSLGYNSYGKVIELSYSRYRGDRSEFEVTIAR